LASSQQPQRIRQRRVARPVTQVHRCSCMLAVFPGLSSRQRAAHSKTCCDVGEFERQQLSNRSTAPGACLAAGRPRCTRLCLPSEQRTSAAQKRQTGHGAHSFSALSSPHGLSPGPACHSDRKDPTPYPCLHVLNLKPLDPTPRSSTARDVHGLTTAGSPTIKTRQHSATRPFLLLSPPYPYPNRLVARREQNSRTPPGRENLTLTTSPPCPFPLSPPSLSG
jgi:hypothetical protein